MSKLIAQIKQRIAVEKQQDKMTCNYPDNYYGDQLCQSGNNNRR
ncbi:hypothetical protein [Alteromonas lipolytica]|nr:hypothetical protein [Alteromonas lipolytica]GGF66061.1 hypothetical protein GCM10011338_17990 [Alteromonas lipolytica]